MSVLGQREVKLRLVHGDGHAERGEPIDDVLRGAVAVVRVLAPDGGEQLDQWPSVIEGGARQRGCFVGDEPSGLERRLF